jgi:hypothetical protein
MSNEEQKFKHSKRILKDNNAIQKQTKIAKSHGMEVKEPHMFAKHHVMDCGNPDCGLCGNPRHSHVHKDTLTKQEKSFNQTQKWNEE